MTNYKDIKKEFKKLKPYIKDISIGQYDDNFVNIGFLDADKVIWNFIESTISQTRQELIEEIKKLKDKDCGWTGYGVLAHHMGTYEQIQASKDYAYKMCVDDVLKLLENHK